MLKRSLCLFLLLSFFLFSLTGASLATVSVSGGLTHESILQPGESREGLITLRNTGEFPARVKVYQTDYLFFADGTNIFGPPGDTPRSNAKWLTISTGELTLLPGRETFIHYTLKVPERWLFRGEIWGDGILKGTYWSMVMVEPIEPDGEEAQKERKENTLEVKTVIRFGVQIVTHIGDSGERNLTIPGKRITRGEDGRLTLELDLANTGERWLRPNVWVELYDERGILSKKLEGGRMRIYPGTSVRCRIDLTTVPEGRYKALVVIDNGDEYIWGAQYDLVIE